MKLGTLVTVVTALTEKNSRDTFAKNYLQRKITKITTLRVVTKVTAVVTVLTVEMVLTNKKTGIHLQESFLQVDIFSRPRQSQELLYKHRCHSLIH